MRERTLVKLVSMNHFIRTRTVSFLSVRYGPLQRDDRAHFYHPFKKMGAIAGEEGGGGRKKQFSPPPPPPPPLSVATAIYVALGRRRR